MITHSSPTRFTRFAAALALGAMTATAMPLAAQDAPPQPRKVAMGGETDRSALNREQAEFARQQLERNAAEQAQYVEGLRQTNEAKAQITEEAAAARSAYEAEVARREAEHAAAMARWEADVAACEAGDFERCSGSK